MERFVMVLDTETANTIEQPLPYDFGWAVVDTLTGEILCEKSFIVAEIFFDKDLMSQAYFAEKIPQYWKEIKQGKRTITSLLKIRKELFDCIKTYSVKEIGAYNMGFDKRASNNNVRYITSSFLRWFFPYNVKFFCIWHMACTSFLNTFDYIKFALENGFVSEAGNIQTSAEVAYRYLINDVTFEESHTGLEDVKIETAILLKCLEIGGEEMQTGINSACWQKVQRVRKQIELEEVFK